MPDTEDSVADVPEVTHQYISYKYFNKITHVHANLKKMVNNTAN